jgi:hypothetical protein
MIPQTLRRLSDRRPSDMDDLKKKVALLFVLVAFFLYVGCASNQAMTRAGTPPSGSKPPLITSYFAPEKGIQGDTIKIYLAAEDPDGDMRDIGTQITQVGYGVYPTDWTYLGAEYRQHFVGYLQWNTGGNDPLPEFTQISINISVFDRWGNQSNQIVLPFEFTLGAPSTIVPPAPFDQADIPRLGYISTELRNPELGDETPYRRWKIE